MQIFVDKSSNGQLTVSDKDTAAYQVTISRIKTEGVTINKMGKADSYVNIPKTGSEYKKVITYLKEVYNGIISDLNTYK